MRTLLVAFAALVAFGQAPPSRPGGETVTIRGRVTDKQSGEPIPRAVVRVSLVEGNSRMPSALTDTDGRYAHGLAADAGTPIRRFARGTVQLHGIGGVARHRDAEGWRRGAIDMALPRAFAVSGVLDADANRPPRPRHHPFAGRYGRLMPRN